MSVEISRPSSPTVGSLTARTMYMFSCDNCPAHQLLGNPIAGCKIYAITNENGVFQEFFMKIDQVFRAIPKGYMGYSPKKFIFTLSQSEAEENFGQHVCQHRLFFQPYLDPYAVHVPRNNIALRRLEAASLECKTMIGEEIQALTRTANKTKEATSKRYYERSDDSTYNLLQSTGEAAKKACGARRPKSTQDPWGLEKEEPSQKKNKPSTRIKHNSAVDETTEDPTIPTLCSTLDQLNLGHLKIAKPSALGLLSLAQCE